MYKLFNIEIRVEREGIVSGVVGRGWGEIRAERGDLFRVWLGDDGVRTRPA